MTSQNQSHGIPHEHSTLILQKPVNNQEKKPSYL